MSHLEIWIALVGMAVVTIVTRAFFLIAGERVTVPDRLQRALRYAPAAALVAIVLPDLLTWQGHFTLAMDNLKLLAGIAATAFYLVTRSMIGMIVAGMAVYTGLRLFG
ncbi:branched-chain amino acid transporter [Cupriavidus sp. USMAA2-4]|uniref:Branched-chain amino acid transporter n=1 Tax=Cupriavidus malaysiensis TaxID=367825 RepID=A0ABM6F1R3_9BURK|nr:MULTISPECIES: AzlD domain-containing protein [Cupriavidus]AOY91664.1 branched-chain amino acid transporter [Cupriavidus sp. USMAA2-4]AOY98786.1 branched-chain amino acid transporter [Cupriavidus sp. USMAHM13]AOZ05210.1 branched-chain amino acid transporter [Cupriavidus malaysiensis]